MRNWLKTLLFISAFSPVLLTLAAVRWTIYGLQTDIIQLSVIGLLGTSLPLLIIMLVSRSGESLSINVKKVETNDHMLIAFVASYFIPIIAKASELDPTATTLLITTITVVLWLVNSLPSHPILRMFRYKFYKIESNSGMVYTMISNRNILHPKEINKVKKISQYMLLEVYK
ncbi:hypothetical protein D3C86_1226650 [compost metagenome]